MCGGYYTPAPRYASAPAPSSTEAPRERTDLNYVVYGDKAEAQIDRVYSVLHDSPDSPMTLKEIAGLTKIKNESSVASRIRDIRTYGYEIERTATGVRGVFGYRLID